MNDETEKKDKNHLFLFVQFIIIFSIFCFVLMLFVLRAFIVKKMYMNDS